MSGLVNGFSLRRINYSLSFNPELDEKYITGEWGDEYYFGREDWENSTQVAPGDPEDFKVPEENRARIDLVKDFSDHGLQVIVKLATIELTPEKPEYSEGSWHVEGQLVSSLSSGMKSIANCCSIERTHLRHCSLLLRQHEYQRQPPCIPSTDRIRRDAEYGIPKWHS